jgi:hypothetical protein
MNFVFIFFFICFVKDSLSTCLIERRKYKAKCSELIQELIELEDDVTQKQTIMDEQTKSKENNQ